MPYFQIAYKCNVRIGVYAVMLLFLSLSKSGRNIFSQYTMHTHLKAQRGEGERESIVIFHRIFSNECMHACKKQTKYRTKCGSIFSIKLRNAFKYNKWTGKKTLYIRITLPRKPMSQLRLALPLGPDFLPVALLIYLPFAVIRLCLLDFHLLISRDRRLLSFILSSNRVLSVIFIRCIVFWNKCHVSPIDQTSKNMPLYPALVLNTSGGMYIFVPQRVYSSIRLLVYASRQKSASPKSATFTWFWWLSNTFSGFKSLCATSRLWRYSMPATIWEKSIRASDSV